LDYEPEGATTMVRKMRKKDIYSAKTPHLKKKKK
jgi:hypothetical protein